jgi:hydroxymethylpyrimidine/phosphomethylpyrimidine kinase
VGSVLDDNDILAMKTGMLYDEATIRTIASTLRKYYAGKSLRLMCDPVYVSISGYAVLVDNAAEALVDEILPLATLITPKSFFRTNGRSQSQVWRT